MAPHNDVIYTTYLTLLDTVGEYLMFSHYSNCSLLMHVLLVIMASGKWEHVGKGGKPTNKCTG